MDGWQAQRSPGGDSQPDSQSGKQKRNKKGSLHGGTEPGFTMWEEPGFFPAQQTRNVAPGYSL
jgi:hypothetical protein